MNDRTRILAYYFPNWQVDARNEKWHGAGWTEWNVTKCALPRFPGHKQPKKPLWGYEDESDPAVMEKKIDTAVKYGVDGFIFDWYFFADGPYRTRCLEEGLLRAANVNRIQFAVMWCNHNAIQAHPGSRAFPSPVLCSGTVDPETFRKATKYCMEHYFSSPSYLRVDGKLFFSIYNPAKMIPELGGVEPMRKLFDEFRMRVREAGLGELHLNGVHIGYHIDEKHEPNTREVDSMTAALGLDSRSGHGWGGSWSKDFPSSDYAVAAETALKDFPFYSQNFKLPYNPVVMTGWDSSPRTVQSDVFERGAYPFGSVLVNNTPEQFEKALRKARAFLESDSFTGNFLLLNSWNEWTEGAFLEPDEEYRYGLLEAVRNVFGSREP
ncbi:MAG: glycoside hydrolase family 99-like domain-containing protein [Lentisphaeria bacterium]|nr:glycoside hydrolase family 99-like domain-containing protein [Lentisphaeria bacterium]